MTTRDSATFPRANGERFAARKMAENYQYRPPYSAEVFETLLGFIRDEPKFVLDAGCGPGKIARAIVDSVDRIDAVDPSVEMIRLGRSLAGGDIPKIRWLNARIEEVELSPPYSLIVADASFHWMRPEIALRRFSEVISPKGLFAILDGDAPIDPPWASEEQDIMIDLVTKIEGKRPEWWMSAKQRIDLPHVEYPQFSGIGSKITAPVEFSQPIADYIRCLHSRATFSEKHLGEELSREFDRAISDLLSRYAVNGMVTFNVQTRIDLGRPLPR